MVPVDDPDTPAEPPPVTAETTDATASADVADLSDLVAGFGRADAELGQPGQRPAGDTAPPTPYTPEVRAALRELALAETPAGRAYRRAKFAGDVSAQRDAVAAHTAPTPTTPAEDKTERRPTAAQRRVLAAMANLGGLRLTRRVVLRRMDLDYPLANMPQPESWVAIVAAGWVTVDEPEPGDPLDNHYSLTGEGWRMAGADEALTGTDSDGTRYAIARTGLHVTAAAGAYRVAGDVRDRAAGAARVLRSAELVIEHDGARAAVDHAASLLTAREDTDRGAA